MSRYRVPSSRDPSFQQMGKSEMISAYEGGTSRRKRRRSLWIGAGLLSLCVFAVLTLRKLRLSSDAARNSILEHAGNSTLGFQKIFVVNLPVRTDHRDAISLAAALTGLDIEYVPGVTDVDRRFLPPGATERNITAGTLGCWRAHMNIIRTIVEQGISSALVLEDDADWDVRIKDQMKTFAMASQMLVQPLEGTLDLHIDPSHPLPSEGDEPQNFPVGQYATTIPSSSPYGDLDRWDFLWLGHCGTRFPRATDETVPLGRAVILNDETVPEPQHVNVQFGNSELLDEYPSHTRVVSRAWANVCTLGYAISQRGARRMLHEQAIKRMTDPVDILFQEVCGGIGRPTGTCLTVQPQLFQHHRPVGSHSTFSDISNHGKEYNERPFTRNIRWSTRLNFQNLIDDKDEFVDLFVDGEEPDEVISRG